MIEQHSVRRKNQNIERDISRVICRLLKPGENPSRVKSVVTRILGLGEQEGKDLLENVLLNFSRRHKNIRTIFERHFLEVKGYAPSLEEASLSYTQKMLIGAYFTMEYSIESAALFNPSIVPHPDQSNLPENYIRFIMSLRAVGEGHMSSLVFRSGIIDPNSNLYFDPVSPYVETPVMRVNPVFSKTKFRRKLRELCSHDHVIDHIINKLPKQFEYEQLKEEMTNLDENSIFDPEVQNDCFQQMHWLVHANYQLDFEESHEISERVIFPVSEAERVGIEDARFVKFYDEETGEETYYAPYTAYDGLTIMPRMIETQDFIHYRIISLNGSAVRNKGLALFPRKINGKYVMLSRQDGENNHIMFSDYLHFWQNSQIIQKPEETWEFIQIGNCGSPMETDRGWLVLTHGVGPMRVYSIGAILLDLDDPTKIIAKLKKPFLKPYEKDREGYVPNVVYTCGALIHGSNLIIPYAMSDIQTKIATVELDELLDSMEPV